MYMNLQGFIKLLNTLKDDIGLRFVYPKDNKVALSTKSNKIDIYDSNNKLVYEINGTKDAMLFYDLLSLVWNDEKGVVFKNRDKYDYLLLCVDNRFTTGYNYIAIGNTALHESSLVSLNRNFPDRLSILFRYKKGILCIELANKDISFSKLSACWEFVNGVKGQINCSLHITYDELIKTYTDWQILYICYLLQYSAKIWCKEIIKRRNKDKIEGM